MFHHSLKAYIYASMMSKNKNIATSVKNDGRKIRLIWLSSCCIIGLLVSFYGYYVERSKVLNDYYIATCDINEVVSCTKLLTSEYSHLLYVFNVVGKSSPFNVPNTVLGMLYYSFMIFIGNFVNRNLYIHLVAAIVATFCVALSGYLSYVVVSKLNNVLCMICMTAYVCNIGIFMAVVPPLYNAVSGSNRIDKNKTY